MNRPSIQSDDRGVTLNKSLAWTMAAGLIGAGLYVGLNIAGLQTSVDGFHRELETASQERMAFDRRLRAVETTAARDDQRMLELMRILTRIEARLDTPTPAGRRPGDEP